MTTPTNVILLQSDNHNRNLLGAYGHPIVQTPNMDRIAAAGARFENAYCASSLCCPSRSAMATGRYPHQSGYWDNSIVYDGRLPSWMHRLRKQGHTCVSVGKLHFRSAEDDNGFSDELAPMHIIDGVGGLASLLRWSDGEPANPRQWQMYATQSGVGESDYQDYDREVTRLAVDWLREQPKREQSPWVLYVSYASPHPPFSVPQRFIDLYPWQDMPLPAAFRSGEAPDHPAYEHVRKIKGIPPLGNEHEETLQRIAAAYFALISHVDEQIGQVLDAVEAAGLLDSTRIIYTSDHGENYGHHGLVGKNQLLEQAVAVPLLACGPDIEAGSTVSEIVSQVDFFPTFVEALGATPLAEDSDLLGESLFPALAGQQRERVGFAEYHAGCSRTGSFMLRSGNSKLIYHVGMPSEFYDLGTDPGETRDLANSPEGQKSIGSLERELRAICDPEEVNARCMAAQRERIEAYGGEDAVRRRGSFVRSPPPGVQPQWAPL